MIKIIMIKETVWVETESKITQWNSFIFFFFC